jgi:predicted DNA-binding transcriptional regulator AlpA
LAFRDVLVKGFSRMFDHVFADPLPQPAPPPPSDEILLSANHVRKWCGGVSEAALYRWLRSDDVRFPPPDHLISGKRYWRAGTIRAFLRAEKQPMATAASALSHRFRHRFRLTFSESGHHTVRAPTTEDCQMRERGPAEIRENRLRRMAERQLLKLLKSRRRDPRAYDFEGWMICDLNNNVVAGGHPNAYGMSIDEVEEYLFRPSAAARKEA